MSFIELLKVIFLGIVEGITEWLPISSTGHMILVDEFINIKMSDEFMSMFMVVIQLGAIMAVVLIYFNKLYPFSKGKSSSEKRDIFLLWSKVLVACVPAGVIGVLFDDWIDEKLYNYITVALMLIVYGVGFILVENHQKGKKPSVRALSKLTYKDALIIGGFQILSLIPGTSRSGATILGGILIGCSRFVAAEFTFFLAIPIMLGASLLKLLKFGFVFSFAEVITLIVGMVTAFLVSVVAIKFLMRYIKNHDFKAFGWYRIVLGFLVIVYFFFAG
ncbi:MAG: undecaprenyl-diphosphate phosphatase [Filifactoraceae bacterium]